VLRAKLIHARDIIRDLGLSGGLRMGPRWVHARRFHVLASPLDATLDVAAPPGVRCAVLGERDLQAFVRGADGVSAREVRRRWRAHEECLVCWMEGEVLAYRWDGRGVADLTYLGRRLRVAPDDGVVLECRTLPGRRRTGAGTLLVKARLERARALGIRRLVGLVAEWNQPSLAWAAGLGWSRVGVVAYHWTVRGRRYVVEGALRLDGDELVVLPATEMTGAGASRELRSDG
jgi:GNAT superfamily N-acetyltransferase